jgi:membrane protein YqaA with SNARE-associated domain
VHLVVVAVPTLVGGLVGWRITRRRWHSLYDEKPVGMSDEAYRRQELRRHLFRRFLRTLLYAALGATIGLAITLCR